jgi:hypothetical protein
VKTDDRDVSLVETMRATLVYAPAVFVGTAAMIDEISDPPGFPSGVSVTLQRRITFRVDESWKGVSRNTFQVVTGMGWGDCGYEFTKGIQYLVVTTAGKLYPQNEAQTGICTATAPVTKSAREIAALRSVQRSKVWPRPNTRPN